MRCLDAETSRAMVEEINVLRKRNESLGGVFELRAFGLAPGLGSHVSWEERLDGRIGMALLSIQALKGVGLGDGFDLAGRPGSEAHDEIFYDDERGYYRETNRSGGLEGGMTTGEPLIVRCAMKPLPTLTKPLRSVDIATREPAQALRERTDSCVVPAAGVVGEAMLAIVLAGAYRDKFGGDHIDDVRAALAAYEERIGWRRRPAVGGRALVFIGFMGAGKTTAARAAAGALGARAVDSDAVARGAARHADRATTSPRTARPRSARRRRSVVCELLERPPRPVLSLGGGAIGSPARARRARAPHRRAARRRRRRRRGTAPAAGGRSRATATRFEALHAERSPLYETLADAILDDSARDAVRRALPALRALATAPRARGWCGRARVGRLPGVRGGGRARRGPAPAGGRAVPRHRRARRPAVRRRAPGRSRRRCRIPPGEAAKTWEQAGRVLRALAAAGMAHDDHVLALGGGVVGDLAGFCAATYQRGVPVVQLPTTLVAQVDSAYGGKTGVDLPEGKNYAGAYHQPAAVLADPRHARDAPAGGARRRLGRGRQDRADRRRAAVGARAPRRRDAADADLVLACARTKLAVVAEDERDAGRRQVLNLGHTVGHAIETATGYARYRHGEAVGLGLLAALPLSGQDALRAEVAALLGAARAADAARPGRRPRGRAGRDGRATRSAAAAASASCWSRRPATSARAARCRAGRRARALWKSWPRA